MDAPDARHPQALRLLLALAPLAAMASAGCLPPLVERPARPTAARVLQRRRDMNHTPPSDWRFGGLGLAAFAAGVLAGEHAGEHALPLP